ncbi:MAG: SPASM domain-containing protein [Desulfuromonadaceae bacterium]|nr:SPASM domain-containing protein [Desulfuromonadaceae bacterium]
MARNIIVLVADQVWPRICKIGYGLKANGWDVVLLHRDPLIISNQMECFDLTHQYCSADDALFIASNYMPIAYHVFSCWNFDVAIKLIESNIGAVVFDNYDVLSGNLHDDFVATNDYQNLLEEEKYCYQKANGICSKTLGLRHLLKGGRYQLGRNIIFFQDYCWNFPITNGGLEITDQKHPHIVYAGNLAVEKLSSSTTFRDNWYFLELAKELASAKIFFDIYTVPLCGYEDDFENIFSDYLELACKTPFFTIHRPVPADRLIKLLSQYDLGLLSNWQEYRENDSVRTAKSARYLTSNKAFDYIDAGLGIIISEDLTFLRHQLDKRNITIPAFNNYLCSKILAVPNVFWKGLRENTNKARSDYDVTRHALRLANFYLHIRSQSSLNFSQYGTSKSKGNAMQVSHAAPPKIFAIESTLACDLRCPECAIGGGMVKRAKGLMTFDQYKLIADKIRPYAQYVYPHIWGEPMLNPDIFIMLEYTATFTKSNISTNGQSMTPEMAERLIKSGVTDIIVSIDGVTQEIYEQYRVGGSLKKALEALAMLQHFNSIIGGRVNISPQFIVFKHNQHQIEDFRKICASLGLTPYFKPPYIRKTDSCFQYSALPEYFRPHFSDLDSLKSAMGECSSPKDVFNVLADGTVVACCHDYGGFTNFGNIFNQDVMEIWNGPKMNAFRTALASGNTPDFCLNKCMSYFMDESGDGHTEMGSQNLITEETVKMDTGDVLRINLCSGPVKVDGYVGIDITPEADITLDLEKDLLPFPDNSADVVACISAINYFSLERAQEIVKDVFRVLKPGGIARFASQDLRVLAERYLTNDQTFFFEKLADGRDRFPGRTIADKFNGFFYGFYTGNNHCKYVYDFTALKALFVEAGFESVEEKKYRESLILAVDKLDNRPEQMFFLEAVKSLGEGASYRNRAFALLQSDPERAWQCLMKALDIDPADRNALIASVDILISQKRYEDAITLCLSYLEKRPVDPEIRKFLQLVQEQAKLHNGNLQILAHSRRPQLDRINERRNRIMSDQEHLAACMKWLRHAQDIHPGGGVSALYHMDEERWGVDYPETTGYIIPTFLGYANLTGDAAWRTRALQMGDWEIAIQTPEGGAGEPVGVSGLRPRVFNTGQVLLGWVALYRATNAPRFLTAACKAADWIVSCQDSDGKWVRGTYSGQPKAYKSRVAWALLELYDVTGEERYRFSAELAVSWILAQAEPNGWFANNSLTDPEKPWTHLIGYVLVGLHEIYRLNNARIDRSNLLNLLHNAAKNMASFYMEQKRSVNSIGYTTLSGTFDRTWQSEDGWSCITGNAQVEFFFRRLYEDTQDVLLKDAADNLLVDLKQIHLVDGITDPAFYGGLQGAYPVSGPYCTYLIPNWGVKFFADSLLQSISPFAEKSCLG